jgi:uncharacterized protein YraI
MLALLFFVILAGAGLTAYFLTQTKNVAAMDTPEVTITAPANDSEVMLQSPVTVWSTISAPGGITRLELWEGGRQINRVAILDKQELSELKASFQWIPTMPGRHTLEVRAYGKSEDLNTSALVVINVIDNHPIPNGLPAANILLTTKTDLIVRAGPGQSYAAVGSLPAGISVMGLGRSVDQQWWQILWDPGHSMGWIPADSSSVAVANNDEDLLSTMSPLSSPTPTPVVTATVAATSTPTPSPSSPGVPGQAPGGNEPPAQAPGGGPGGQPRGGGALPEEAFSACSGLAENDSCELDSPMGTLSGTCTTIQEQLACMPAGGPPGGRP